MKNNPLSFNDLSLFDLYLLNLDFEPDEEYLNEAIRIKSIEIECFDYQRYPRCRISAFKRQIRLYRARLKGQHIKAQWELILKIFDYRCACCNSETIGNPTKDHIVPISCGGSDGIWNLQPLCRECNSSHDAQCDYRPMWMIELLGCDDYGEFDDLFDMESYV